MSEVAIFRQRGADFDNGDRLKHWLIIDPLKCSANIINRHLKSSRLRLRPADNYRGSGIFPILRPHGVYRQWALLLVAPRFVQKVHDADTPHTVFAQHGATSVDKDAQRQ